MRKSHYPKTINLYTEFNNINYFRMQIAFWVNKKKKDEFSAYFQHFSYIQACPQMKNKNVTKAPITVQTALIKL